MSDGTPYNRRIGDRLLDPGLSVVWRADADESRHFWKRGGPRPEQAELLDLSVSGARVRASAADDLRMGSLVVIEIEGQRVDVRVRHVQPIGDGTRASYGVRFVDPSPELAQVVYQRIAAARTGVTESRWRSSH